MSFFSTRPYKGTSFRVHVEPKDNNELFDVDFDPAKDVGLTSSSFASLRLQRCYYRKGSFKGSLKGSYKGSVRDL